MRRALTVFVFLLVAFALQAGVRASFNATYLSTTVFLSNSTTAHVFETINLYISNSSIAGYVQDRQAINLTLSEWQQTLGSDLLVQHILNPKSSISNFTFLPGPPVASGNAAYAVLTLSYYANNVTSVVNIAPRQFEYSLNSTVFNFQHTVSGQSLLPNSRLTIIIPNEASVVALYPAPDSPQPDSLGRYTNSTFSWYSREPLQKFTFTYVITETPQQEVMRYFTDLYKNYTIAVYAIAILIFVAIIAYIYIQVFR